MYGVLHACGDQESMARVVDYPRRLILQLPEVKRGREPSIGST